MFSKTTSATPVSCFEKPQHTAFGDADADGQPDILQENHYYPFGMAMTMSSTLSAAPPNNYLYNGKELQPETGWLDYGARMYDASIGRWNGVDALAEKYVSISPYIYVADNPLMYIDPNGKEIWIYFKNEEGKKERVRYEDGNLYNNDGTAYEGEDPFVMDVFNSLNYVEEGKGGETADPEGIISALEKTDEKVRIKEGKRTGYFETSTFRLSMLTHFRKHYPLNQSIGSHAFALYDFFLDNINSRAFHISKKQFFAIEGTELL